MAIIDFMKQKALGAIDAHRDDFVSISLAIHGDPEVAFEERRAAARLCDALETHGFTVTRGVGGLETAFLAECAGSGPGPAVAMVAEYDALPGIGHACGHNIIGTSAVAAAIGAQAALTALPGRVVVVGTPAEEGGGGKITLLKNGVFDGIDAAMMVHPASYTVVDRGSLASMRLFIEFHGRASHAAAAPEDGISALEALIQTFNNINSLRLHLRPDARVHGIITHGGTAANIIPEYARAVFSVRSTGQSYTEEALKRVVACAQAAATATGARLELRSESGYMAMLPNATIGEALAGNWRALDIEITRGGDQRMGSTDFGDLSQALPAVHAYMAIVPPEVAGHTIEFREASCSPAGHAGLINAAKGMALTVIDLLAQPQLLEAAREEFERERRSA